MVGKNVKERVIRRAQQSFETQMMDQLPSPSYRNGLAFISRLKQSIINFDKKSLREPSVFL